MKTNRRIFAFTCFGALLIVCALPSFAQRLQMRRYDVGDGLANSIITSIHQDQKGFIWIGTQEGLSHFDSYTFVNYGVRDGLGHQSVNQVTQDRQGRLWVATNGGGVSLLLDGYTELQKKELAEDKFISFRVGDNNYANYVNRLIFDSKNNLWCLTDFGLYRASLRDLTHLTFEPVLEKKLSSSPKALLQDRRGRLWFALENKLFEIKDGQIIDHGSSRQGAEASGGSSFERGDSINSLIETPDGRLVVSTFIAVYEFIPEGETVRGEWVKLPLALAGRKISLSYGDSKGILWFSVFSGTDTGVIKYQNGQQKFFSKLQGLDYSISAFGEDRDGNLWFGTFGGGIYKFSGEAFILYTKDFSPLSVLDFFETVEGNTIALLRDLSEVEITESQVKLLPREEYARPVARFSYFRKADDQWTWGSGWYEIKVHDPVIALRDGEKVSLKKFFTDADLRTAIFYYEDENSVLWLVKGDEIYRKEAGSQALLRHAILPEKELLHGSKPQILSDRVGGLWFSSSVGLCRMRGNQFQCFQPADGLPAIDPRALFVDSRGWLWVGLRYNGVSVTRDPKSEQPKFTNYSSELSSNVVWFIAEDDFGRMYFATERGLVQFDVEKNLWHFSSKNELPSTRIGSLTKDRQGNIWICTASGLTKFNPKLEPRETIPPPIYFSRVNIAGESLPMAETGTNEIPLLELQPSHNNLTIEFVGLDFSGEDVLTYQYKLEGVDADWSAPTRQRLVNYARLTAGNYHFLVRAINRDGLTSLVPAAFEFRILSPLYQRWWFIALAASAVGLLIYLFFRYRLAQKLEVERVRTRIAADLHDDIGANLTKIGVLSEVVYQQASRAANGTAESLASIANLKRESVAAMGDIVWAINPKKDSLRELIRHMREFAGEIFANRDIDFEITEPDADMALKLGADVRRTVFLIFKEAINNIVRHADCKRVDIELQHEGAWLILLVTDDGCGFETQAESEGNGLISMRRRAAAVGGFLDIISREHFGTRLMLRLPIKPGAARRNKRI